MYDKIHYNIKNKKKLKKKEHSSNFSKLTQSTVTIWSIFLLGESDSPVESRIKEGERHTKLWENQVPDRDDSEGESLTWSMLTVLPE